AEEERFRRIKHWAGFPTQAINFCLHEAQLQLSDIDFIAINSDSSQARWSKLKYVLKHPPSLELLREKLRVRQKRKGIARWLEEAFPSQSFNGKIIQVEHHLAHLASAYSVSGFDESAILSVDGFGDFASAAWGYGEGAGIEESGRVSFPHSLGIFYQAMTQYLGFPHYGDEYKIMGLAPYGKPLYAHQMDQIVTTITGGEFRLNLDYFVHQRQSVAFQWDDGVPVFGRLFSDQLSNLLGPPRDSSEPLTQYHRDIARSVQDAYERRLFDLLDALYAETQSDNLSIAGGCGMNSVANGKVHSQTQFKHLYVQSAAGDAGGAIGAAIVAGQRNGMSRPAAMDHAFLGPSHDQTYINELLNEAQSEQRLDDCEVTQYVEMTELYEQTSDDLVDGKVVGWFQGSMEWGPRALGNRSILGDARREDMKDILNLKIKRRESFRPFAPSILEEYVGEWFESVAPVPFMMKVFQILEDKRREIPAVTHVDGSGRLQTVSKSTNPRYWSLIQRFYEKTGVPMVLNTSFNENEPVVCKPEEALDCFLRTNMDVLVLGATRISRH
ncbi:MAG: carbamoyltransferase C-terminal domain-containing protein, partial [Pseudomonadota bacterium]